MWRGPLQPLLRRRDHLRRSGIRGRHPLVIDRETFDIVQAIRTSRGEAREKTHKHPQYLKGSLVCDYCSWKMGVITPSL
jgi:hypothetical protein